MLRSLEIENAKPRNKPYKLAYLAHQRIEQIKSPDVPATTKRDFSRPNYAANRDSCRPSNAASLQLSRSLDFNGGTTE